MNDIFETAADDHILGSYGGAVIMGAGDDGLRGLVTALTVSMAAMA
ncbi:hypothetical protein C8J30_106137 [Rhodobacter viridis]|uniref:Uncharacterized protein n=1 Tax=Rhodobacter viridis TaxID=1054202 RepID=A0A318U1G5_9RHOB|nr:hypothetical protein [Rhodobacter viridis]PYF10005.1 hypothetical protein C8J30_106137 [Rhodobacter viridis]